MKKILSICFVALLALPAVAAEPKEDPAKRDYSEWLPAAGDISLGVGVDLAPLASFVGNMFNNTTGNTWDMGSVGGSALSPWNNAPTSNLSIMGAYMLTDQLGIRANIGFGFYYNREREYVTDDALLYANPFSRAKVIDVRKTNVNTGSFSAGVDYRIGKRAVQGVFGGGVLYGLEIMKTRYAYGNAITEINQNPTTSTLGGFWGDYTGNREPAGIQNPRVLQGYNNDPTHFFGLYGSAGVEWFVAPKVALGLNVNLNLLYYISSQQYIEVEGWNASIEEVEQYTELIAPGDSGFEFSIRNIGANLYAAFYF